MSVLVVTKFAGDAATFRQALAERSAEFEKIGEAAKARGALHHRFGVGDGFILVVDEWATVEQFKQFFGNPELQAFIGTVGGSPQPPEVIVTEAVTSSDEF